MSRRFWTADMHLGHANINKYARRPWLNPGRNLNNAGEWISDDRKNAVALAMNNGLVAKFNSRVSEEDTCFHVGDFCCRGNERGVSGAKTRAAEWEGMLNGKMVFFEGNHDHNNGLKFFIRSAIVKVGPYLAFVRHAPISSKKEMPGECSFVIHGHVHIAWSESWVDNILCINVGVDVRKYAPIDDSEVVGIFESQKRKREMNG